MAEKTVHLCVQSLQCDQDMLYRLIVLSGPLKGRRLTIDRAPMTVGRDPSCEIHLEDEEVARRHAVIEHNETGLCIRDLGTMNRVLVNKREVRETYLKHGDEIEIGRTRFLVQALIQAEVEREGAEATAPAHPRRILALAIVLLLILMFYGARNCRRATGPAVPEAPALAGTPAPVAEPPAPVEPATAETGVAEPPPPTPEPEAMPVPAPAPAVPAVPTEVAEELRSLRATLATIKETVEDLTMRTPPPSVRPSPAPVVAVEEAAVPVAPPPDPSRWLLVEAVEQVKLPASERYDEARLLKVRLRPAAGVAIDPAAVRLEALFYSRAADSSRFLPARSVVAVDPPALHGRPLTDGQSAVVDLEYHVPQGAGGQARFYGFRLRVYYRDVLQAEIDRPRTLPEDLQQARRGNRADE